MSEDLPTFGCPTSPIVKECLTGAELDEPSPEAVAAWFNRKPLMSSIRGLVDEPEADWGVEEDEAERWERCCWVEDLKGIVGAWRRRWESQAWTTAGGTRSA